MQGKVCHINIKNTMRRYLLFVIFILSQIPSNAQTKQDWSVCRDSVFSLVKKCAEVAAADQSAAFTLYDCYLIGIKYDKVDEVRKLAETNSNVTKCKQMCDSLTNEVKQSFYSLPGIYVIKKD